MDSARYKFEQQCADCGSSDFVEDHANGDLVCTVWTVVHIPIAHRTLASLLQGTDNDFEYLCRAVDL